MDNIKIGGIGIIAGFILGYYMKAVELLTGKKVYVLLLNVDYFPVLQDLQMSEEIEFLLHLIVSVMLVYMLYVIFRRLGIQRRLSPYIIMNFLIGACLFPTTVFSERTPTLHDGVALVSWLFGHIIYGAVVGWLIIYILNKRNRST